MQLSRSCNCPRINSMLRSAADATPWPKLSCDLSGRVGFVPAGAPSYIRELTRGGALDWSRATLIQIQTLTSAEDWETWCNHSKTDTSSARKLGVGSGQLHVIAFHSSDAQ